MKIILILFCLVFLFSGCVTSEYYTNPQSAGYNEKVFGCLCENCNRVFHVSYADSKNYENATCCYCGHTQNLLMASRRFDYAATQQQAANNQQMVAGILQAQSTYYQQTGIAQQNAANQMANYGQQMFQNSQQRANQQGTVTNPINVKIKDY